MSHILDIFFDAGDHLSISMPMSKSMPVIMLISMFVFDFVMLIRVDHFQDMDINMEYGHGPGHRT